MVCTKKPLLVLIVESRGFFGSANNASCLDNAFVSLHLRLSAISLSVAVTMYVICFLVIYNVFTSGASHIPGRYHWLEMSVRGWQEPLGNVSQS